MRERGANKKLPKQISFDSNLCYKELYYLTISLYENNFLPSMVMI